MMASRLLSASDVADRLGVSRQTAHKYLSEGRIPATQTPGGQFRVQEVDLVRFMRANKLGRPPAPGPKVLAVANQKGGVGKTTTAVALSAALADQGQRVLLVDLDPQANATMAAGFDMTRRYRSIYDVMRDALNGTHPGLESVAVALEENWWLVPSHIDLAKMELDLFHAVSKEYVLKDLLDPLRGRFDWILIDCPPALGMLTINALTAADQVLVPQVPDFISAQGLQELMNTITVVRRRPNPDLTVAGVLLTRVRAHVPHHKQMREQIAEFCERANVPLLSAGSDEERERLDRVEIPDSISAANAAGEGVPLARYKTRDGAGAAYRRLAQVMLAEELVNA